MEQETHSFFAARRVAHSAWAVGVGLALMLAACGGGGGADGDDGFSVNLAAPSATPQPRQMSLGFSAGGNGSSTIAVYRAQWRPDAQTAYAQIGADIASNATTALVELPDLTRIDWTQASARVQACNGVGTCVTSNEQPMMAMLGSAVGYFKASNTEAQDGFGDRVVLSADGSTLAVAALDEDSGANGVNGDQADNSAAESGAVYVFVRGASGWEQQAYLKASNSDANDNFGSSMALSSDGSSLAIGADRESSNATGLDGNQADNSAPASGAVYLFSRQGGAWSQSAYVKASNTAVGDGFGVSVALSANGQQLAVGAFSQGAGGAAYVFERNANVWTQVALLKASNEGTDDRFGRALALAADGNTLAVGARDEDSIASGIDGIQADNSAAAAGAVFVFTRSGLGVWSQQAYVKASNTDAGDRFGYSVTLSADGGAMVVGARSESSAATGVGGDQSSNALNSSGAAYVFVRAGVVWSQQAYLKASNTGFSDSFGFSLALAADGQTLAVGAVGEDSNANTVNGAQDNDLSSGSGAVYLFASDGGLWTQSAYVKAPDNRAGDRFGQSVSLSADGSMLVVGASSEDSSATGIDGNRDSEAADESGSVYMF